MITLTNWFQLTPYPLLIFIFLFPPTSAGGTNKIDPELKGKIDLAPTGSTWNVIVGFNQDPNLNKDIYRSVANITDKYERTYQGVMKMQKRTNESQKRVVDFLKKFQESGNYNIEFKSLWINNDLALYRARKDLIYMLGENEKPEFENITEIMEDKPVFRVPDTRGGGSPVERTAQQGGGDPYVPLSLTYGINKIRAPAWWRKGFNGTGVIIGHMDTGVDIHHPSLKWNYYGKPYGWLDPGNASNTWPYEYDKEKSHGTHTLGIAVGWGAGSSNKKESDVNPFGVGVAPGARWMSCLACQREFENDTEEGGCPATFVDACAQWLTCPSGKPPCPNRPDVISISLGFRQNKTSKFDGYYRRRLQGVLESWKLFGIFPVIAAGNQGEQGCVTLDFPADQEEVISVGSIDTHDVLDYASSWGPPLHEYNLTEITDRKIYKPDFAAPGEKVFSSVYTGIPGKFMYDYESGTSMAAPHMAGAIALLLSRTSNLTMADVREILEKEVLPNFQISSRDKNVKCGGKEDQDVPNHKFGYGGLTLTNPDSLNVTKYPVLRPTRKMPPPPDYSDLPDDYDPSQCSVSQGMVGLIMMALLVIFKNIL